MKWIKQEWHLDQNVTTHFNGGPAATTYNAWCGVYCNTGFVFSDDPAEVSCERCRRRMFERGYLSEKVAA